MDRPSILLLVSFSLAFLSIPVASAEDGGEREVPLLPPVVVTGREVTDHETRILTRDHLEAGGHANAGEAILELPGVHAVRRSASMTEPVIRGLGWERVETQFNHLPMHGACPGRMDPPITYAHASWAQEVRVVKGIPSVTLGPGGTGGRIQVVTDYERLPGAAPGVGSWLRLGHLTARSGWAGDGGILGGNEEIDFRATLEALDYGDYRSAGGTLVPATQKEFSTSLSFAYRPSPKHRWWHTLSYVREAALDYPSLPMDLDRTDLWVYSGGYRVRPEGGRLGAFEAEFGLATNDHRMSNERKPNRERLEAATSSEADGLSGRVHLHLDLSPSASLFTGIDAFHLARDAIRTRVVVATGQAFEDHMWPDASQDDLGIFGEALIRPAERWRLRAGARVDVVSSDARAVDDPSLGGRTIRENYVLYNGEAASEVRRRETLGTGNIAVEHVFGPRASLYLGGGVSSRAAGLTERTFALATAPGGFQIGNPSLDPELKTEAIVGFETEFQGLHADLSVFHSWFDDYIYQTIIAREDIDGDGNEDVIRGFRNVKARLYGGEAGGLVRLSRGFSVPIGFAIVRGENRSSGGNLPEIPPLEGTVAVRFDARGDTPWWWEIGGRFAARQQRIDPAFGENETPGFAVIHLRGGAEIGRALAVNLAVENLLDHEYHEHLTREAALPVGGLARGDEVPAPGFTLMASVRYSR